jgi:hypothetical protein
MDSITRDEASLSSSRSLFFTAGAFWFYNNTRGQPKSSFSFQCYMTDSVFVLKPNDQTSSEELLNIKIMRFLIINRKNTHTNNKVFL